MTRSLSTNTIMGLNVVGLRRAGFSAQERQLLKKALDILYRSQFTTSQAVQHLREQFIHPLIQEFCDFISASERGICHFVRRGEGVISPEEDQLFEYDRPTDACSYSPCLKCCYYP